MSSAAAFISGQEAAGTQGFLGSKGDGLPEEGLGGLWAVTEMKRGLYQRVERAD